MSCFNLRTGIANVGIGAIEGLSPSIAAALVAHDRGDLLIRFAHGDVCIQDRIPEFRVNDGNGSFVNRSPELIICEETRRFVALRDYTPVEVEFIDESLKWSDGVIAPGGDELFSDD